MILITGAGGKTGRALVRALSSRGEPVRAFVHSEAQIPSMRSLGAKEVMAGDMRERNALDVAFTGVRTVYHICPAVHPDEVEMGQAALQAARKAGVERFVYHSVLHPQLGDMPHHQKKLEVEALLLDSGLPFTIIQPAVLMQNLLETWKPLREAGVFRQKFFTKPDTRMGMVDLEDVALAASLVLTRPGHEGATYELCGPENLSLGDMVAALERHLGRGILVETPPDEIFAARLRHAGAGDYQVETLLKMFRHYNAQGFPGNPNVLTWILGKKPGDFPSFLRRTLDRGCP